MLISAGISAAGSVAGGLQANGQGKYEAAIAKQNAQLAVEQGRMSEEAAHKENKDYWRKVSQDKGQQIAAMAANGIEVDTGTAARVQNDTTMLSREDANALYKNQANRTRGFVIDANNYVQEAKAARAKGKAAMIGSFFQAASTLASGAQQFKGMKAKGAFG